MPIYKGKPNIDSAQIHYYDSETDGSSRINGLYSLCGVNIRWRLGMSKRKVTCNKCLHERNE